MKKKKKIHHWIQPKKEKERKLSYKKMILANKISLE